MRFVYEPALMEYMEKKKRDTILVEMVEVSGSDIEISELHVQLADERQSRIFLEKKGYGLVKTEHGKVLLPRFPLQMEETVTVGLKKFLFFKYISYKGIKI